MEEGGGEGSLDRVVKVRCVCVCDRKWVESTAQTHMGTGLPLSSLMEVLKALGSLG